MKTELVKIGSSYVRMNLDDVLSINEIKRSVFTGDGVDGGTRISYRDSFGEVKEVLIVGVTPDEVYTVLDKRDKK